MSSIKNGSKNVPKPTTRKTTSSSVATPKRNEKKTTEELELKKKRLNAIQEEIRKPKISGPNKTVLKPTTNNAKKPIVENTTKQNTSRVPAKKIDSTRQINSNRVSSRVAPSSTRTSKTQFYPDTKKMYSNALSSSKAAINSAEKSTKKEYVNDDNSKCITVPERPRTATLEKGSIVNENIVGPESPEPIILIKKTQDSLESAREEHQPLKSPEENYEDDFDSYESDFEPESTNSSTSSSESSASEISNEETSSTTEKESSESDKPPKETETLTNNRVHSASTDEDRKLDSGNFDLNDLKKRQLMININESIAKENQMMSTQNLASLSDEGFEEAKSLQFINFLGAKKKHEQQKLLDHKRKRGEELMSMIKLDVVNYTLLELQSTPYEEFIKRYGVANTIQTATQTGENFIDEMTQTDQIISENKWTQNPTSFEKLNSETEHFWKTYKNNLLGVGSDVLKDEKDEPDINYKNHNLDLFLQNAGNLVMNILREKDNSFQSKLEQNDRDLVFSKGYIRYQNNILEDKEIKCICFNEHDPNVFLSAHYNNSTSTVCVWNISNVTEPQFILTTYGNITCCSFNGDANLIFGGLSNGSIVIWETTGRVQYLKSHSNKDENSLFIRPIFITKVNFGHNGKVVAIQSLQEEKETYKNNTNQVCTLDEEGSIIVWSIILKHTDQNQSCWEKYVLLKNIDLSLSKVLEPIKDLVCTDMLISNNEPNKIYIGTNYGHIYSICLIGGNKFSYKVYKTSSAECSQVNCLEKCPFSSLYFLAGFNNGDITLYSKDNKKPLMIMSNKENEDNTKLESIQWSAEKPCIFYAKDSRNTLHIWDLNQSNIFPIASVPFSGTITSFKLSPTKTKGNSYMLVAIENKLLMHVLHSDYTNTTNLSYEKDVQTFINYVNRL